MAWKFDIERLRAELIKPPAPTEEQPAPDAGQSVSTPEPDLNQEEFIRVRLLGGKLCLLERKNVIGCCHYMLHPGKLTKQLLRKHNCLEKKCPFLEKYEDTPFWVAYKRAQLAKSEARQQKQIKKAQERSKAAQLQSLRDSFQSCADATGSEITVVRVEPLNRHTYRAFYVSDNTFPDWNQFPAFVNAVERAYPDHRVSLRRIVDLDGHFVTRDEYDARKR